MFRFLVILLLICNGVFALKDSAAVRESAGVSYREETAFELHRSDRAGRSLEDRANKASSILATALEAKLPASPNSPDVEVGKQGNTLAVKVRGYLVIQLSAEDAEAAGYDDVNAYAEVLKPQLSEFVPKQRFRMQIQQGFLRFFLSVFVLLVVFLVIRGLHKVFVRSDEWLDENRGSFKPVRFMSETIVSGETLAGLVVFAVSTVRILSYFMTVVLGMAFIFSQFEGTRQLLQASLQKMVGLLINGVEALIGLIPGLLVAAALIFALQTGLRIYHLFLKGVSSQRISRSFLPPIRIPIFRFFGSVALVFLFAPLIIASVFGRFDTPFETMLLVVALAFAIGAAPALASLFSGVVIIWRQMIQPGDWIQIGDIVGEVTTVHLSEVRVVPANGGEMAIPMIYLLWHPLKRSRQAPDQIIHLELVKSDTAEELLDSVRGLFRSDDVVEVKLKSVSQTHIGMNIISHSPTDEIREKVLLAIAKAAEAGTIQLYEGAAH